MVKKNIKSEEHLEKLFTLIIVCKYRDYLVLRECEDTNARLTFASAAGASEEIFADFVHN